MLKSKTQYFIEKFVPVCFDNQYKSGKNFGKYKASSKGGTPANQTS
jgi:hypothetical protein